MMGTLLFKLVRLFFGGKQVHLLVLLQNDNELRGGGGFITQVVDVTIGRCFLRLKFLHDKPDLDKESFVPTAEIRKYLKLNHLYFRDANYDVNFATNTERLKGLYNKNYPDNKVAGILAVNYTVLESFLSQFGSVMVNGCLFSAQNVFSEISTRVSNVDLHDIDFHKSSYRKNILQRLFKKLFVSNMIKIWRWPSIWSFLRTHIEEKNIQIFFTDNKVQEKLLRKKLALQVVPKTDDFLMVNENNYLGIKNNRYIRRIIFHDVDLVLDREKKCVSTARVKLRVVWEHFGSFNYPFSGTYQSYVFLGFPAVAVNVRIFNCDEDSRHMDDQYFKQIGFYMKLRPGDKKEVSVTYDLPCRKDNSYSFSFIKQPGVQNEHIFECVSFPDQFDISIDCKNATIKESRLFLNRQNIHHDYDYVVSGKLSTRIPRIFYHEIVSPSEILIMFNEPVFMKSGKKNLVVRSKKNHEEYAVSDISFENDNRHLRVTVKNLPEIEEAFYTVEVSAFVNLAGIPLSKTKRELTVVYRSKLFRHKDK